MKKWWRKCWTILWKFALWFNIVAIISVVAFRFIPVPLTPLMLIRAAEMMMHGDSPRIYKSWVSIDQMSPSLPLAVVASEDQRFLFHHGFDWEAIQKAMDYNKHHKIKRGASTISQQTAKNVFLWQGRNYIRKALEVYFTFLVEACWSKQRILEVYLNIIEMGKGIYGVEAASQYYFNKPAIKINNYQAALIAAILPSPRRYSAKNPGPYVARRQAQVLSQMNMLGGKLDFKHPVEPRK